MNVLLGSGKTHTRHDMIVFLFSDPPWTTLCGLWFEIGVDSMITNKDADCGTCVKMEGR